MYHFKDEQKPCAPSKNGACRDAAPIDQNRGTATKCIFTSLSVSTLTHTRTKGRTLALRAHIYTIIQLCATFPIQFGRLISEIAPRAQQVYFISQAKWDLKGQRRCANSGTLFWTLEPFWELTAAPRPDLQRTATTNYCSLSDATLISARTSDLWRHDDRASLEHGASPPLEACVLIAGQRLPSLVSLSPGRHLDKPTLLLANNNCLRWSSKNGANTGYKFADEFFTLSQANLNFF